MKYWSSNYKSDNQGFKKELYSFLSALSIVVIISSILIFFNIWEPATPKQMNKNECVSNKEWK
jgi:hypothetical protein